MTSSLRSSYLLYVIAIGLTRLGIKPECRTTEADALTTRPSELYILYCAEGILVSVIFVFTEAVNISLSSHFKIFISNMVFLLLRKK